MTQFKLMVTQEGKHPPAKWAELIADEIIEISAEAPQTLMKEAVEFRNKIVEILTGHVQTMSNQEQARVKAGKHDLDMPYETEGHADVVANEIATLAAPLSFADHFKQPHVKEHLAAVLNRYFKSAQLVERHHYHSEKARAAATKTKK